MEIKKEKKKTHARERESKREREEQRGVERTLSIHNCCLTHWPNSAVPGLE